MMESLDANIIWKTIITGFMGLFGWIVKDQMSEVKKLRDRLDELPNVYARRDDVKDMQRQVMDRLDQIYHLVEKKADK